MLGRRLLPRQPAMTEKNRGSVWKTEQRRHRLDMMLTVDKIGRTPKRIKAVNDRHGRIAKFSGGLTEFCAVDDRLVSAAKQTRR